MSIDLRLTFSVKLRMMFRLLVFQIIFILLANFTFAETSDLYEQKSKIEKMITERMKSTIATTLDKNSFDVSVSIKIKEKKAAQKPKILAKDQGDDFSKLQDLHMGLINTQELIKSYEKELEKLRLAKEDVNSDKKGVSYEITEILVQVGLTDKLEDSYFKQFGDWLKKRVVAEFGRIGKSSVTKIKVNLPDKPPKTWMDYLKEFQLTLAVLMAILGILMTVLLYRYLKSKNSDDDKQIKLELSGPSLMPSPVKHEANEEKESLSKVEPSNENDLKLISETIGKLVTIIANGDIDVNQVVDYWLTSDANGLKKTACVLDAILAHPSSQVAESNNVNILKSVNISPAFKSRLADTLVGMHSMKANEKLEILDTAYWDILTFQTVGDEVFKKPFNYTTQVEATTVKNILMKQPTKVRSMVVLTLPHLVKEKIVSEFSEAEKRELLYESFNMPEIKRSELDSLSDAIKFQITNDKKQEGSIKSLELLPSLLSAFTPLEEMTYLCETKRKSPELLKDIASCWASMALIEAWNDNYLIKYISKISNEEIESIIRINSESKDLILNLCTPRVREIVTDSLRLGQAPKFEQIEATIKSARTKLTKMLDTKEIKFESLYKENYLSPGLESVKAS